MSSPQTGSQGRRLQVFLCHDKEDGRMVRNLDERLRQDGFAPWLDEQNLLPGQSWPQAIPAAIRSSDIVVACLSRRSVKKEGYVQKEIKLALSFAEEKPAGTIFVIPACLERGVALPPGLSDLHSVHLYEKEGYPRLINALNTRARTLELVLEGDTPRWNETDPFVVPPNRWWLKISAEIRFGISIGFMLLLVAGIGWHIYQKTQA